MSHRVRSAPARRFTAPDLPGQAGARQQRAHLARRLLEGRRRRLLSGQCAMDPHLQDLGQLAVDRRRRPRDGRLEHLANLIERNRQSRGELRGLVERTARRQLCSQSGTLDHLLGRGQKRHELEGECRVGAPGVDGQLGAAERGGGPAALPRRKRRNGNASRDARSRFVLQQRPRVRPVAHERRFTILEREAHLLFLPRQRGRGDHAIDVDRVHHEVERADRRWLIDDHAPARVENTAAERREVLEEHRDEPFVARARPDQPETCGVGLTQSKRHLPQLGE